MDHQEPGREVSDGFTFDLPDDAAPGSRRATASGFLLTSLRSRPIGRTLLSALTAVLFLAGAGMFAYPFFTDMYTQNVVQGRLQNQFADIQAETFGDWQQSVQHQTGKPLTKISIPTIGLSTVVVEGTSPAALRAGAGHYPDTPLPGQPGNVAIAGHRTTYGHPFNQIDKLAPGDVIWLSTPVGDYQYVVSEPPPGWDANPHVVMPTDWSVIQPTETPSLTLTSCHPKGSAARRLVVRATLVKSEPPGTYEQQAA